MADKSPVPGPTLAEKRDKTIKLLIDSFASDRLTVEDFESRLDQAHRAPDVGSLDNLVADLPAVAARQTPAADTSRDRVPLRPEHIRESQFLVSVLGGFERKGSWIPARKTRVLSFMGGAVLDFREAQLAPGVTEIELFAMMGGVEIIVPPGVAVDSSGIAIMGSFAHGPGQPVGAGSDAPVIRVGGLAIMGGVEIHVRLPGETAGDVRRRLRAERKRLRRHASDE